MNSIWKNYEFTSATELFGTTRSKPYTTDIEEFRKMMNAPAQPVQYKSSGVWSEIGFAAGMLAGIVTGLCIIASPELQENATSYLILANLPLLMPIGMFLGEMAELNIKGYARIRKEI